MNSYDELAENKKVSELKFNLSGLTIRFLRLSKYFYLQFVLFFFFSLKDIPNCNENLSFMPQTNF